MAEKMAVKIYLVINILRLIEAFVLPLPIELGTDVEFDLSLTLPYTVIFPDIFGRRRRSTNDAVPLSPNSGFEMTVAKLESIFLAIGVEQESCQDRLFCAVHRDPDKYSPLSDVILQHMDVRRGHYVSASETVSATKMHRRYRHLVEVGQQGLLQGLIDDCVRVTPECLNDPDQEINWNLLNILKIAKTYFGLKFQ